MTTTADQVIAKAAADERRRHEEIDRAIQAWSPRGDRLVLARIRPTERKLDSGIVIPGRESEHGDKIKREGMLFRVVAAGPDALTPVNAEVYCASFAGALVDIGDHTLLVIKEDELLLVGAPMTPPAAATPLATPRPERYA